MFPPETKGRCELSTSWDQKLNVDVTKYFKDAKPNEEIFFKNRVSVTGKGEGFAQLRIEFDKSRAITNDVWTSPNQNEFDKAVKLSKKGTVKIIRSFAMIRLCQMKTIVPRLMA